MAGVKISALSTSASFTDTDVIPVVSGGITKKVTGAVVKAAIGVPAAGTVGSTQLANGSVTTPKFATGAVDAAALGALAVETAKINDSAVTTAKIANDNVTSAKLSPSLRSDIQRGGQSRAGSTIPTTGSVKGVAVLSGGSGYTSGVTISIAAPPSGVTATATATVVSGVVTAITITDEGSGYTDQNPAVTITAVGAGSGATAVAYAMVNPFLDNDNLHSRNGGYQNYVIASDDSIIVAGANVNYCLGIGDSNNDQTFPTAIRLAFGASSPKPIQLFSSGETLYVLASDGTLWSCGNTFCGQVGRGITGNTPGNPSLSNTFLSPITFSGGGVVKKFATNGSTGASSNTTCLALVETASGQTLYGWGYNGYGQLGNGGTSNANTPQVLTCSDGASTITDIAVIGRGMYNACYVLFSSGRVKAAGYNGNAALSRGNTSSYTSFDFVYESAGVPLANVKEIAGMDSSYLAVLFRTAAGTIVGVGYNANGELGTGNTTSTSTYVTQTVGAGTWPTGDGRYMYSCGGYAVGFTYAFKANGDMYVWGYNAYGQIGGTLIGTPILSPYLISGFTRDTVSKVALISVEHLSNAGTTAILKTDGSIHTSGYNGYGQCGNGSQVLPSTLFPVRFPFNFEVKNIVWYGRWDSNHYGLMILTSDGSLYCTGSNSNGIAFRGGASPIAVPAKALL